jgi:hypothetical protein
MLHTAAAGGQRVACDLWRSVLGTSVQARSALPLDQRGQALRRVINRLAQASEPRSGPTRSPADRCHGSLTLRASRSITIKAPPHLRADFPTARKTKCTPDVDEGRQISVALLASLSRAAPAGTYPTGRPTLTARIYARQISGRARTRALTTCSSRSWCNGPHGCRTSGGRRRTCPQSESAGRRSCGRRRAARGRSPPHPSPKAHPQRMDGCPERREAAPRGLRRESAPGRHLRRRTPKPDNKTRSEPSASQPPNLVSRLTLWPTISSCPNCVAG